MIETLKPLHSAVGPWRMVACDLDGTLIGWDHTTTDRDLDALRRARSAGLYVAIVTGRNARESIDVIRALDLSGPGVFANGAMISDMAAGTTLDFQPMPRDLVDEVVAFFAARNHVALVLVDEPVTRQPEYLLMPGKPHRATAAWLEINRMRAPRRTEVPAELRSRVLRIGACIDASEALPLERALSDQFGTRLYSYSVYSQSHECQVIDTFAPSVSKWSGIVKACELVGIAPESVITIGDEMNDLAMLENATLSFAMGNAPPAIQRRAKRVTGHQKDSGVAQVIDLLLAGKI